MIAQNSQLQVAPESLAMPALPPSERDFEVYEIVVIEGETTRAAAAALGISQTRVVQITSHVAEWMGSEVPPTPRLSTAQRLAVATDIASRRLDFLYSQAMQAWRESKGQKTTQRSGGMQCGESSVTRESQGDPRHLAIAMRIAERGVSLAVRVQGAEVRGQASEAKSQEKVEASPVAPPVEDCSSSVRAEAKSTESGATPVAASGSEDNLSDKQRKQRKAFFGGPGGQFQTCSERDANLLPSMRSVAENSA